METAPSAPAPRAAYADPPTPTRGPATKCAHPGLRVLVWALSVLGFAGAFLYYYLEMFEPQGSGMTRLAGYFAFMLFIGSTYNALIRPIHLTGFVTMSLLGASHIGGMLVLHSARPATPPAPVLTQTVPNLGRCVYIESLPECPGPQFTHYIGAADYGSFDCGLTGTSIMNSSAGALNMEGRSDTIRKVMELTSLVGQLYREIAARAGVLDAVWTASNQTACETAVRSILCNALFPRCDAGCNLQLPCTSMCFTVARDCGVVVTPSVLTLLVEGGEFRDVVSGYLDEPNGRKAVDTFFISTLACGFNDGTRTSCGVPPEAPLSERTRLGESGRIEVLHNGQWGTVCNRVATGVTPQERQDAKNAIATVVCRELGYGAGTFLEAFQVLEPSDPSVPIWFNADPSGQLCVGTESSIWDCQNLPVDFTNTASDVTGPACGHRDDIGVRCEGSNLAPYWSKAPYCSGMQLGEAAELESSAPELEGRHGSGDSGRFLQLSSAGFGALASSSKQERQQGRRQHSQRQQAAAAKKLERNQRHMADAAVQAELPPAQPLTAERFREAAHAHRSASASASATASDKSARIERAAQLMLRERRARQTAREQQQRKQRDLEARLRVYDTDPLANPGGNGGGSGGERVQSSTPYCDVKAYQSFLDGTNSSASSNAGDEASYSSKIKVQDGWISAERSFNALWLLGAILALLYSPFIHRYRARKRQVTVHVSGAGSAVGSGTAAAGALVSGPFSSSNNSGDNPGAGPASPLSPAASHGPLLTASSSNADAAVGGAGAAGGSPSNKYVLEAAATGSAGAVTPLQTVNLTLTSSSMSGGSPSHTLTSGAPASGFNGGRQPGVTSPASRTRSVFLTPDALNNLRDERVRRGYFVVNRDSWGEWKAALGGRVIAIVLMELGVGAVLFEVARRIKTPGLQFWFHFTGLFAFAIAFRAVFWWRLVMQGKGLFGNSYWRTSGQVFARAVRLYWAALRFYRSYFGLTGKWYYEKRYVMDIVETIIQLNSVISIADSVDSWQLFAYVVAISASLIFAPLFTAMRSELWRRDIAIMFDVAVEIFYMMYNLFIKPIADIQVAQALSALVPATFGGMRMWELSGHLIRLNTQDAGFIATQTQNTVTTSNAELIQQVNSSIAERDKLHAKPWYRKMELTVTSLFIITGVLLLSFTAARVATQEQQCYDLVTQQFWTNSRPRIYFPNGFLGSTGCSFGAIKDLSLKGLGVTAIPDNIYLYSAVSAMDLSDNSIAALPLSMASMALLRELDLRNNAIAELPVPLASQLQPTLTTLRLQGNPVAASVDWSYKGLVSYRNATMQALTMLLQLKDTLQSLNLRGNQLVGWHPLLDPLVQLRDLDLSGNRLRGPGIPDDFVTRLPRMRNLNLSHNNIAMLPRRLPLSKWTNLQSLDFSHNRNMSEIPPEIHHIRPDVYLDMRGLNVRYLDFGSTAMKNFTHYVWQFADTADGTALTYNSLKSLPAEFGQLRHLRAIYASNNELESLPDELGQLSALWWLAVHENFLTSLPASLGQCTLLEVLEARRNNLRALPDSWGSLISLTTMDLRQNELTALPAWVGNLSRNHELRLLWLDGNPIAQTATQQQLEAFTGRRCSFRDTRVACGVVCDAIPAQGTYHLAAGARGNISSNARGTFYRNFTDCEWVLKAPAGHTITVTFPFFQVIDANRGGTECQADWVELRDGGNRTAPYIPLPRRTDQLKLCASPAVNTKVAPFETDVFRTTNNELYVYFQTDHFQVELGWTLVYQVSP